MDWIQQLYYKELMQGSLNYDEFYYNEEGKMVMTEKHHLKRGYCCLSGCKHCPYTKNTK